MSTRASVPGSVGDAFVDQVDNCTGDEGLYSRIFGDLTTGETGPFDPSYSSTLLSDGRLNSSDAPMPALKIVYNSAGGMGGFANSCLNDKDNVYNRNVDVTNPVPSGEEQAGRTRSSTASPTARRKTTHMRCTRRTTASTSRRLRGIRSEPRPESTDRSTPSTPASPTTSPGFGWYGQYQNWQIANDARRTNVASDTTCRLRDNPLHGKSDVPADQRLPDSRVIFTDEHGEARANWLPGLGADFFNDVFVDMNGGCDLEGLTFPAQTITASARYPFQPVGTDIAVAGSITKNINNLFHKSVSCVRKDNTSSAIAYICTASAQDIDGQRRRLQR